ncbi:MAG: NAD(P)-dependent oxidoreductase, partial [Clostridiaceae bacterium]|nr:NAD(P)-dependent oxidoreductase [Clostridiaceae bacterium]
MILITGATSQVGELLVDKLVSKGYRVRCLVRESSKIDNINLPGVEFAYGDLINDVSLENALKDVEYIVHIAGIWRVNSLLKVCRSIETLKKVIFVGSTSIYKKADSIDKWEKDIAQKLMIGEDAIRKSGVNYVILRPTMIYGINKDKNILQIINFMNKYRCYPVIGSGQALKQPIYAGDIADAILLVLSDERIINKEYIIGGKSPIKYKNMLKLI